MRYQTIEKNLIIIDKLREAGLLVNILDSQTGEKFIDKIFVLTGSLKDYTREEATQIIKNEGGIVSSNISKLTDFVIAGKKAGSKLSKAKNLNIKILNEDEFKEMLNS